MIFQLFKFLAALYFGQSFLITGDEWMSPTWQWVMVIVCVLVVFQSFFTFFRKFSEWGQGNFMAWLI